MDFKLENLINILKNGGVVALPTDTVYGLVAIYGNKDAFDKIYKIKNRPKNKKLILFIDKIERLNDFCDNINIEIYNYLKSIWPGPTTVILNCKNDESIGFRIPNNELVLKIIEILNVPLYSTSANISNMNSVNCYDDLDKNIIEQVDYCVKGICLIGMPSTIIDLRDNNKKILR